MIKIRQLFRVIFCHFVLICSSSFINKLATFTWCSGGAIVSAMRRSTPKVQVPEVQASSIIRHCQVPEAEQKCDKNRKTHSVHGAGLGGRGGQASEPPRTLAMDVYYNGEVPWQ